MKKVFGLAVLSAALGGCGAIAIDTSKPVPGWPEMKVIEHRVSRDEMLAQCQPLFRSAVPEACTLFYFDRNEAHIWVRNDFLPRWILTHERWHAAGYDHVGSTNMQRALEAWKASQAR